MKFVIVEVDYETSECQFLDDKVFESEKEAVMYIEEHEISQDEDCTRDGLSWTLYDGYSVLLTLDILKVPE